ncbi:MAG: DUF420 domain-containing protein [Bryobacteraceae bacterium]
MIRLLPTVDAFLNAAAAVLLIWGYTLIRRKRVEQHRRVMLSAFVVSMLFLACYLVYHSQVGSVHFLKTGPIRTVYFAVLISHLALAFTVPVLAVITLSRALRRRFDKHRRIARWTLPIWLYVSVTGVIVYFMLYRL